MSELLWAAGTATAVAGYARAVRRWARIEPNYRLVIHTTTRDGAEIALYRTPPTDPTAHAEPVLLVHGLGSNHFNFDLPHPGSLPQLLADAGYDCWTIDLRGRLGSSHGPNGKWRFGFDDYLRYDIPAAVERVLAESAADKVHWIGHSMGGMLFYAMAGHSDATGCDIGQEQIASAVTIGSPIRFFRPKPMHRWAFRNRDVLQVSRTVPLRAFGALTAPFVLRGPKAWVNGQLNPHNCDDAWLGRAAVHATSYLSMQVFLDFVRWIALGQWNSVDGKVDYRESMKNINVPTLVAGGRIDYLCPVKNTQLAHELLGSEHKKLQLYGTADGHQHDYGHIDLVMGRHTRDEVVPDILAWLAEHRWR